MHQFRRKQKLTFRLTHFAISIRCIWFEMPFAFPGRVKRPYESAAFVNCACTMKWNCNDAYSMSHHLWERNHADAANEPKRCTSSRVHAGYFAIKINSNHSHRQSFRFCWLDARQWKTRKTYVNIAECTTTNGHKIRKVFRWTDARTSVRFGYCIPTFVRSCVFFIISFFKCFFASQPVTLSISIVRIFLRPNICFICILWTRSEWCGFLMVQLLWLRASERMNERNETKQKKQIKFRFECRMSVLHSE